MYNKRASIAHIYVFVRKLSEAIIFSFKNLELWLFGYAHIHTHTHIVTREIEITLGDNVLCDTE